MNEITTKATHTFSIFIGPEAKPSVTPKMARAIEEIVNKITKHDDIVQLPVEQFEETFLVRMGPYGESLAEEANKNIVSYITHVSLKCEVPEKKQIFFGIWKRLKVSEILK